MRTAGRAVPREGAVDAEPVDRRGGQTHDDSKPVARGKNGPEADEEVALLFPPFGPHRPSPEKTGGFGAGQVGMGIMSGASRGPMTQEL